MFYVRSERLRALATRIIEQQQKKDFDVFAVAAFAAVVNVVTLVSRRVILMFVFTIYLSLLYG